MNCEYCGKEFEIKHGHYSQRFCCKSCSVKARNLEDAGLFNNGHHISTVAYILGLILTDGCIVDCSGHKYIVISLKEYDMIAAIRDIVCRTKRVYKDGNNYQVRWRNDNDVKLLESMSIVQRKTFSVKFIYLEYGMWDFIRGVFDGDGCVYISTCHDKKYNRDYSYKFICFSTASKSFARGLCEFLNDNQISARIQNDSRDREMYYIKIYKQKDVKRFAEKIYADDHAMRLERKYVKLKDLLTE